MKGLVITSGALALMLAGCGSQRNLVKTEETKTEVHFEQETVRTVSVDTSKTEELTVTVTEWFYGPADDTTGAENATVGEAAPQQLKYKRQTTYTNKRTESGVTEVAERDAVKADTVVNASVNENVSVEKGTNTVRVSRNIAWIVGLCVLLVVCVIMLILVLRYKRR